MTPKETSTGLYPQENEMYKTRDGNFSITTDMCSISCATNNELFRMAHKPSYSNYYRLCILKEMVARGL